MEDKTLSAVTSTAPQVKRFSISGLQGERNVDIDFSSNVSIFVADNGVGKTTILSAIYAVLSGRLHRLRRLEFDTITVEFAEGPPIEIPNQSILPALDLSRNNPRMRRLFHQVPESVVYRLFEETRGTSYPEFRRHPLAREIVEVAEIPPRYLYELLHVPQRGEQLELSEYPLVENLRDSIGSQFQCTVLYFPTYRRIEEELDALGYERKETSRTEGLIQFGMADVSARINRVTDQIKNSSVAWYSRINGEMLSQFVEGIKVDESTRDSIRNKDAMKIVLDRIGENITPSRKQHIIQLVESNEIKDKRYDALVYFLSNLIKIYDQQKELDNSIKEFTRVCNNYLVEKEIVYNESDVEIQIIQRRNRKEIGLANLSSGEKQIISLFSQLYLETGQQLALLFDEPELSLGIEWQRMLLPDIIRSGRCKFLLATTHSPFIFENELDPFARDLSEFITYS